MNTEGLAGRTSDMMTVGELAGRLAVSRSKVYALIEAGTIGHYRIGGSIRVSEEQLTAYLESCKVVTAEQASGSPPAVVTLKNISL